MKTFRNTIILFIVFAALLGFYYYNKSTKKPTATANVVSISKSNIESIDIKSNNNEVTLKKSSGNYELVKPISYKADSINADDTLNSLTQLKYSRKFSDSDLKKYGLDNTSFTIEISSNKGETENIIIGNKSPVGNAYYVKSSKSPDIYVVDASSVEKFLLSGDYVFNYIDKSIFTIPKDKIAKITYIKSSGTHDIQKDKSGKWKYNGKEINNDTTDKLLDDVVLLNASGLDLNKKAKGNNSSFTLTISDGNKSEEVKFLTDDNSKYYIEKNNENIGIYITKDQLNGLISDLNSAIK